MASNSLIACVCLVLLLPWSASAQSNQQEPNPSNQPQSVESAPATPTFHTESRQVLVQADVWNPGAKKHATDLVSKPGLQPKGSPIPARGLTAKDFHVFDNGIEQRINFLKELDFDARWADPWSIEPDISGEWGVYDPSPNLWEDASATYLIGYVPPTLQAGECRTVSVVVEGYDVDLNRTQYCSPKSTSELKAAATVAESQMQSLADLHGHRLTQVSIRIFSFWSSGVLRLLTESPSRSGGSLESVSDYRYVVQVHDSKAPATVHIATEFHWKAEYWQTADCFKRNPAVHMLGTVYKANGVVETQFKGSISCLNPRVMQSAPGKYAEKHGWLTDTVPIPTRFNTQVELPPGDYNLRVVVTDGTSFGQAQIPLHVQEFDGHQLGVSDIVLGGVLRDSSWVPREAASVYPAPIIPTPLVSKGVQFFPSTDNRVPRQTPVSFYFEIYEPLLETQTTAVSFSVKITNLKTNSLAMDTGPMSAAIWMTPGNAVIPIGLNLNIDKLKPGSYRLEIQASDSAGRETQWRQAMFTVE
jgi:hypothetical protein